jgi:hypothetical protein
LAIALSASFAASSLARIFPLLNDSHNVMCFRSGRPVTVLVMVPTHLASAAGSSGQGSDRQRKGDIRYRAGDRRAGEGGEDDAFAVL